MKQVAQYTKVISNVYDMVSKAREEWEVESSARSGVQQTSSMTDTHALVAAVGMGKGLKNTLPGTTAPPGGMSPGMMVPPAIRPHGPLPPAAAASSAAAAQLKAPAGIKTNIKSANQIHPYGR